MKDEKYFIVTEANPLHNDYKAYRNNSKLINEHVKQFCQSHGIKAEEYVANNDSFYIVATNEDKINFKSSLGKAVEQGIYPFKKNSKIGKAWVESLKEKKLKVLHRPMVGMYFRNAYGRHRSRLFEFEGNVYCSFESESGEVNVPEGMKEIKASEFFKVIEDSEKVAV